MKEKRRNKKKLTTLIALLMCAILAFGIAGSLAYYTSVSEKITNIFSYDSSDNNEDNGDGACVSITLSEVVKNNNTGETTNVAEGETANVDLISASDYTKTATVTVDENSIRCYIFVLVEDTLSGVGNEYVEVKYGDDADQEVEAVSTSGCYTLYYFGGGYAAGDAISISIDISVSENVENASQIENIEDTEIVFYSYAIQVEGVSVETAKNAAIEYYNESLGINLTM